MMEQGRAERRLELGAMVKLAVPVVLSELGWMEREMCVPDHRDSPGRIP
jgi:hypothetical protein